mmetsp:Transcript_3727/g.8502  ORF Transcript_3727/g.8502 Transcript_3727/m.8502 type:complete len:369 (-) Transcript_3727:699-1805(-)
MSPTVTASCLLRARRPALTAPGPSTLPSRPSRTRGSPTDATGRGHTRTCPHQSGPRQCACRRATGCPSGSAAMPSPPPPCSACAPGAPSPLISTSQTSLSPSPHRSAGDVRPRRLRRGGGPARRRWPSLRRRRIATRRQARPPTGCMTRRTMVFAACSRQYVSWRKRGGQRATVTSRRRATATVGAGRPARTPTCTLTRARATRYMRMAMASRRVWTSMTPTSIKTAMRTWSKTMTWRSRTCLSRGGGGGPGRARGASGMASTSQATRSRRPRAARSASARAARLSTTTSTRHCIGSRTSSTGVRVPSSNREGGRADGLAASRLTVGPMRTTSCPLWRLRRTTTSLRRTASRVCRTSSASTPGMCRRP